MDEGKEWVKELSSMPDVCAETKKREKSESRMNGALPRAEGEAQAFDDSSALAERLAKAEKELAHYKTHYQAAIAQRDEAERQLTGLRLRMDKKKDKRLENDYIAKTERELAHYKAHYQAAMNQAAQLRAEKEAAEARFAEVVGSASWKLTWPIRATLIWLKRFRPFALLDKGLHLLKQQGVRAAWKKTAETLRKKPPQELYTQAELARQRQTHFKRSVVISILVPVYNTPEKYLKEMLDSVLKQTYAGWELCLADGSDREHDGVGRICRAYARRDSRIRYQKLEKNQGISGNTNACIDMASGEYIALFDHDDLLHPAALYEVMQVICREDADLIYTDENTFRDHPRDAYCPHHKPDFAPDTLRANNYICHLTVFRSMLLQKAGRFRPECDGSQDYDMVLRLTEQARRIVHIPKILYYWRAHPGSVADSIGAKPYVLEAARRALRDHLTRVGLEGEVGDTAVSSIYRIRYRLTSKPLVSIIIPNKDHADDLRKCVSSICEKTTYPNWEIVIVENNSTEKATLACYRELEKDPRIRVITWDGPFNYSAINNFGAEAALGSQLLLLNNDTEVIAPEWIEEMLMFAQRSDVGAVGAKLYYPDDTIQHAGLGLGLLTLAGHLHRHFDRNHPGYMGRLAYAQDLTAVTAACVMIPRRVWSQVGGLDPAFQVAFNDVDLCMRIRKAGYLVVWTPFAELYHYESKSRGLDTSPEKRRRFEGEVRRFQERWAAELAKGDPYYNPNLTLDKEDFSLRKA